MLDPGNTIYFVRLIQAIAILLGGVACGIFLYKYRRFWNIYDGFARFVILLNVGFMLIALTVALPRFFYVGPFTLLIEVARLGVYIFVVALFGYQLRLMRRPEFPPQPFTFDDTSRGRK